ncbi:MAG: amidohydrolase [Firmicutes bacterium]|nr:amidohydrolase [Bacillota bacterium]
MRIQNGILLTMEGGRFENGYIEFENGKITAFGDMTDASAYDGDVLDAAGGYILPGLIDAHTHIGIGEEGLRWEGIDYNEITDPVTPQLRAMDGFNPFDTAIEKAAAGGVTTAGVSPGSANVIGGQIAAIKLRGKDVDDMVLKAPAAMKFALGENPKNCYGNHDKAPKTRMMSAALMREALIKAQRYMEKKEKGDAEYDAKSEALIPVLKREIPVHVHAHRADDMLTAIRIANEFNLRFCIVHATRSAKIADVLAGYDFIPIVGPSEGPASKPETVDGSFATAGILRAHGMTPAITTDHDVQPLWLLPMYAAMCVREGLSEEDALKAITIVPARALGVEDRVGSIAVGKDADIAVFSGHPFHYMTKATAVFIDGLRVK